MCRHSPSHDSNDFRTEQSATMAANILALGYLAVAIASGGRRSVHDFIARTVVQRKPNQVLTKGA